MVDAAPAELLITTVMITHTEALTFIREFIGPRAAGLLAGDAAAVHSSLATTSDEHVCKRTVFSS